MLGEVELRDVREQPPDHGIAHRAAVEEAHQIVDVLTRFDVSLHPFERNVFHCPRIARRTSPRPAAAEIAHRAEMHVEEIRCRP